jgi:hypothetical protein
MKAAGIRIVDIQKRMVEVGTISLLLRRGGMIRIITRRGGIIIIILGTSIDTTKVEGITIIDTRAVGIPAAVVDTIILMQPIARKVAVEEDPPLNRSIRNITFYPPRLTKMILLLIVTDVNRLGMHRLLRRIIRGIIRVYFVESRMMMSVVVLVNTRVMLSLP